MKTYFITGIGTDVGKTIAAALIVQALKADYWKPIQAGDLEASDTLKVKSLIANKITKFHPETYQLNHAMSPHAAAERDRVHIDISNFDIPKTNNHLVIEGAGGLLVPLNRQNTLLDLIEQLNTEVILVSKHYLGSINHTLMSVALLQQRKIKVKGILFNGLENKETESIIKEMTGLEILGRIAPIESLNKTSVAAHALKLKNI